MEVLDENGNMIGFTEDIKVKGINNEGINVAAAFEKRDFNFVDKANSGQLGQHQIILESSIPLQRGCRVKIKYPNDYNITENLTSVRGTGFFESLSGADELSALGQDWEWRADEDDDSVTVIGCKKNYGGIRHGVLTLTAVRNQRFVHDSESFKILMTVEKDEEFKHVY